MIEMRSRHTVTKMWDEWGEIKPEDDLLIDVRFIEFIQMRRVKDDKE